MKFGKRLRIPITSWVTHCRTSQRLHLSAYSDYLLHPCRATKTRSSNKGCFLRHNTPGALPKNMWRVCSATLTPIFKPPVTEWPLFIFHILLSPNDPHFQNALSLNDPLFLEIFIGENGGHAKMTPIFTDKWRPCDMYPIFVWKEGFM